MLTTSFHPLRWNAPKAAGDVHFIPKDAKSFAASRACQDAKLQSPRRYARLVAKGFHEAGERVVIQGRVMFDGAHIGPMRKQFVEMCGLCRHGQSDAKRDQGERKKAVPCWFLSCGSSPVHSRWLPRFVGGPVVRFLARVTSPTVEGVIERHARGKLLEIVDMRESPSDAASSPAASGARSRRAVSAPRAIVTSFASGGVRSPSSSSIVSNVKARRGGSENPFDVEGRSVEALRDRLHFCRRDDRKTASGSRKRRISHGQATRSISVLRASPRPFAPADRAGELAFGHERRPLPPKQHGRREEPRQRMSRCGGARPPHPRSAFGLFRR